MCRAWCSWCTVKLCIALFIQFSIFYNLMINRHFELSFFIEFPYPSCLEVSFSSLQSIVTRSPTPWYIKLLLLVFQYCLYIASLIICKKKEQCTHHFVHNFYPKQSMGPRLANSSISSQSMPTLHFYKANLTLTFKRTMHPSRVE